MNYFHRVKRDSRILGFIGLTLALTISLIFMLIGFIGSESEQGATLFPTIIGIVGICIFVIFLRGSWMATAGATTHIFSINETHIEWGFLGKEKQILLTDIAAIYWNETDGLTLNVNKTNGDLIRFPYIETIVSHKSRASLLTAIQNALPTIKISGNTI